MTDLERWQEFQKNNPPKPNSTKPIRTRTNRDNRYAKEEKERQREERIRKLEEERTEKKRKREDIEDYYGTVYEIKNGICEYCNNIQEIKWNGRDWIWSNSEKGLARYPDNGECILLHDYETDYGDGIEAVLKVNFCPVCGRKLQY